MSALQLFHTCLVNEFFPSVGFAVVRVLEHLGFADSLLSTAGFMMKPVWRPATPSRSSSNRPARS
jgi:Fe-S oxidoreductase